MSGFNSRCRFCGGKSVELILKTSQREFYKCGVCDLIFVPQEYFVSLEKEKEKYDQHQNSSQDLGYRKFLSKISTPMQKYLKPKDKGLDFGSGPGPTLSKIFEEVGYEMEIYDYFYANNPKVFEKKYDFITTTEVVEHLHNPKKEIERLWNCLKIGGVLGIMTAHTQHIKNFKEWYYIRDLTHICFFSNITFEYLGRELNAKILYLENDVVIFEKL